MLAALPQGELVEARFNSEPYGAYSVVGRVAIGSSMHLGGIEVGNNGKPVRELMTLEPRDTEADDAEPLHLAHVASTVASLAHGDVVEATFVQEPYGTFTITGICVLAPYTGEKMVGSWFLTTEAEAAKRLVSVDVVARASEHTVPVPRWMTAWASEREGSRPEE